MQVGNYSMCHGVFGNAELLLYAAEILQQPDVKMVTAAAEECISDYINKKYRYQMVCKAGMKHPTSCSAAATWLFLLTISWSGKGAVHVVAEIKFATEKPEKRAARGSVYLCSSAAFCGPINELTCQLFNLPTPILLSTNAVRSAPLIIPVPVKARSTNCFAITACCTSSAASSLFITVWLPLTETYIIIRHAAIKIHTAAQPAHIFHPAHPFFHSNGNRGCICRQAFHFYFHTMIIQRFIKDGL